MLFAACAGELVEARLAIVFGDAPFGGNGTFLLEFEKQRVERALVERELVAANLLDATGDVVAMQRSEDAERLEDHEGKGALGNVGFVFHEALLGNQQESGTSSLGKQQESPHCKSQVAA